MTTLAHQIFVYFKTPVAARDEVSRLIRRFAAETGAGLAAGVECSRRKACEPGLETDTWLEHYRCENAGQAQALLARLNNVDPNHAIIKLTIAGPAGRHIEHFSCV